MGSVICRESDFFRLSAPVVWSQDANDFQFRFEQIPGSNIPPWVAEIDSDHGLAFTKNFDGLLDRRQQLGHQADCIPDVCDEALQQVAAYMSVPEQAENVRVSASFYYYAYILEKLRALEAQKPQVGPTPQPKGIVVAFRRPGAEGPGGAD